MRALNGSGRAPAAASIDQLRAAGHTRMPGEGVFSVSIPGTVHGWETILAAHGSMPLAEVLKPAIRYAEEGFPVSDLYRLPVVRAAVPPFRAALGPGNAAQRASARARAR